MKSTNNLSLTKGLVVRSICAILLSSLLIIGCQKETAFKNEGRGNSANKKSPSTDPVPTTDTTTTTPGNISFSPLTSSFIRPGAGAEHWGGHIWDDIDAVKVPAGNTEGDDYYYRFNWRDFETTTRGSYNWTEFDRQMNFCITNGKKLNFGVMTLDGSVYKAPSVGGAYLTYPDYLHSQMQAETYKDWIGAGLWIPNWNSNSYLTALENLNKAIADHINTTSYNGKLYKNAIGYIDVRGYGNFGEWHNWPYSGSTPTGTGATAATLKRIIDSHTSAFPNHPLVAMSDGFATWGSTNTPPEIVTYLLTTRNAWGLLGWRRDNWGNPEYSDRLENNPVSGAATLIMDRWKTAPIVGETWTGNADVSNNGAEVPYFDLERQARFYHAASFGNGNYQRPLTEGMRSNIRNASNACGYKLGITSGTITTALGSVTITLNWTNTGVAPTYEDWNVVFDVVDAGGRSVTNYVSTFKPKLFTGTTSVTDVFSVPAGDYTIKVTVKDANGYRKPMPLNITGRNADGSYNVTQVKI